MVYSDRLYRSRWRRRLDAFFKNYSEEDLLAFVEDILVEDEDQELTTVGKEIILICSKSLIDLMKAKIAGEGFVIPEAYRSVSFQELARF